MSDPASPSAPRAPRWMRLTLGLSLALNLLIVGVVVGAMLGRNRDGGPGDRLRAARDLAPPPFVLALEPEARRALVQEFRDTVPKRQSRREIRTRLREILTELRSEAFNADSMAALLAELRNQGAAHQAVGADVFVRHLSAMSAEERRAYADQLEAALRRGSKR